LVELGPSQHEAKLAALEIALNGLQGVDPDLGVPIGVLGVKVGIAVIVVVHPDHDPEEKAYARHRVDPFICTSRWQAQSEAVIQSGGEHVGHRKATGRHAQPFQESSQEQRKPPQGTRRVSLKATALFRATVDHPEGK
jgi:hypothetical protein